MRPEDVKELWANKGRLDRHLRLDGYSGWRRLCLRNTNPSSDTVERTRLRPAAVGGHALILGNNRRGCVGQHCLWPAFACH